MKGRKPVPTALKVLAGNPGHRPINTAEPKYSTDLDKCPAWLEPDAKRVWKKLVQQLGGAGVLTQPDQLALAMLCQNFARWQDAEIKVKEKGQVVTAANGSQVANPYIGIANRAQQQFVKLAAEFGLTPTARARLKAQPDEEETLAEVLFKNVSVDENPGA